ncbi:MAG: NAD(P)H-hydrate epimerase, partial [Nitrososphaeraceae archaeon]
MNPKEASISSRQMYQIENHGYSLLGMHKSYMMENAGHGLADFIISKMGSTLSGKSIVSLCGTGNNGGDAIVASRHLA